MHKLSRSYSTYKTIYAVYIYIKQYIITVYLRLYIKYTTAHTVFVGQYIQYRYVGGGALPPDTCNRIGQVNLILLSRPERSHS